jgi:hypothetical protein
MARDLPPTAPRDELGRADQVRREFDEAAPSTGFAGVIIAAIIVVILGIVLFGPSAGNNTSVATRDAAKTPAPAAPPSNQ